MKILWKRENLAEGGKEKVLEEMVTQKRKQMKRACGISDGASW